MSYEYKLIFDDTSITQRVMNVIKNNDARLISGNENSLWLQVNVKSANLYKLVLNTASERLQFIVPRYFSYQ
ncbi:hypothetical protein PEC311524_39340 [Pectobacterium carotovorum subsp. carotovorum]|nr:hypothetical protein PEC311524_39340 [Pectobacterium carotovorum subsp. carotovorum]